MNHLSDQDFAALRENWASVIAHLERCLDDFLRSLPSGRFQWRKPERSDIVWRDDVLPIFRKTLAALNKGYSAIQRGDLSGFGFAHVPLRTLKKQNAARPSWMRQQDERIYEELCSQVIALAENIIAAERAHWYPLLTPLRAHQTAMLYRYASLDYVKEVDQMLTQVISGEPSAEQKTAWASTQEAVMLDKTPLHNDAQRWQRTTREFLTEMRTKLRQDIANRAGNRYRAGHLGHFFTQVARSDAYDSYRMTDEYEVCEKFVGQFIYPVEDILVPHSRRVLHDRWFSDYECNFLLRIESTPNFCIRPDIAARMGEIPPRAGVYLSQHDAGAAPQFAWPEEDGVLVGDDAGAEWHFVEIVAN